ncbi:MAG: 3-dehydroquinate dehydratase [bacterium]|jgi:3-dehydroquinate dehydratase II
MNILIINGPNLNLTGEREAELYGNISFEDYFDLLKMKFPEFKISMFQSNVEGELINRLHEADLEVDAVILNAGGYTHTSVAIADAVKAVGIPVIEVHISNILAREEYRHISHIAPHCVGAVFGFGLDSYRVALSFFRN